MRRCSRCAGFLRPGVDVCQTCGRVEDTAITADSVQPPVEGAPTRAELDELFGPDPLQETVRRPRALRKRTADRAMALGFKIGALGTIGLVLAIYVGSQNWSDFHLVIGALLISPVLGFFVGLIFYAVVELAGLLGNCVRGQSSQVAASLEDYEGSERLSLFPGQLDPSDAPHPSDAFTGKGPRGGGTPATDETGVMPDQRVDDRQGRSEPTS